MKQKSNKSELKSLINKLISKYGFTIYPDQEELILSHETLTADEFTENILISNGLDPKLELNLYRTVKRLFTDRFGNEIYLDN